MLAEARRKIKYSSDPRNTNWTNDDNKFGQKLMEKMGWAKGRGLGVKEDGNPLSIAVSLKNDTKGMGWNKKQEDNWIAHQDDFNDLLSSLNENHGTVHGSSDENGGHKVQKLEQTSRTSKGRVHYQKFTKGKDLSLRSETDLDCVFGKRKSKKKKSEIEEDQIEPDSKVNEDQNTEDSGGLVTVTSTDSVQDYFAKKMAALKNKRNGVSENTDVGEDVTNSSEMELNNDINNFENVKNKKKKKKYKKESDIGINQDEGLTVRFSVGDDDDEDDNQETSMDVEESCNSEIKAINETENELSISKKNKKDLKVRFSLGNEDNLEEVNNSTETKEELCSSTGTILKAEDDSAKKKKKKSKKKKMEEDDNDVLSTEKELDVVVEETADHVVKDRKNSKNGGESCDTDAAKVQGSLEVETELNTSKRKDKKKRKSGGSDEAVAEKKIKVDDEYVQGNVVDNASEDLSNKKKKTKKKKKRENEEVEEISEVREPSENQGVTPNMEPVDMDTVLENQFLNTNPEKVLLDYARNKRQEVQFVLEKEGQEHRPIFKMHVEIGNRKFRSVLCRTKKDAKKRAGIVAVTALGDEGELKSLGLKRCKQDFESGFKSSTSNKYTNQYNTSKANHSYGSGLETVQGYPGFT